MSDKNLKMDISKFITGECMKKALIIFPIAGLLLVALAVAQVSQDISLSAIVQPYYSVVFHYDTVDFGAVLPGATNYPALGNNLGVYHVDVESNIALTISVRRTPWSPYDYLTLKFASDVNAIPVGPEVTVGIETPTIVESIAPGIYTHYHAYWIDVSREALPGSYSANVTITYQSA